MKNLLLTVYFISSLIVGFSQSITLSFQGEDTQTNNGINLQSVFIQNLSTDSDTIVYGTNPTITLNYLTGIDESSSGIEETFEVVSTIPNPFIESTFVHIKLTEKANLFLSLMSWQGKKIADLSQELNAGFHKFEISSSNYNLLLLHVSDGSTSRLIKLLKSSTCSGKDGIKYAGLNDESQYKKQKSNKMYGFEYNLGDQLLFTANAAGYVEDMIADDPLISTNYNFQMDPLPPLNGFYIKGSTTACSELHLNGLMSIARNEVRNMDYNNGTIAEDDRPELKEIYMAVEGGGSGFNIVHLVGGSQINYGPGEDFALVPELELDQDEPKNGLWRGSLVETEEKFVLPDNGLYHIAFDEEIMIVVIAKVDWGVIGAATPYGWGISTDLLSSGFNPLSMTFEIPEITMFENEWKFRYSNGWKVILDPYFPTGGSINGIKVNANFGGQIDDLVAGGYNIMNDEYAVYKITMNWELGAGHSASFIWVDEAEPLPEYPDTMYIVGDGTAYGWDSPGTIPDAIMHKCAGGSPSEGIYWKICHLETDQLGFRVSDADWGAFNFGYNEIEEFDPDGVTVIQNGDNMDVAESGMYIVVLNLQDDVIRFSVKEAEVYGIGDTFGGWDPDVPENLFTINNVTKTLTSPALISDGDIRMYPQHTWIPDWWQSEFNVYEGVIEYRNDSGYDLDPVPGIIGQVITLHFDDNTGSID